MTLRDSSTDRTDDLRLPVDGIAARNGAKPVEAFGKATPAEQRRQSPKDKPDKKSESDDPSEGESDPKSGEANGRENDGDSGAKKDQHASDSDSSKKTDPKDATKKKKPFYKRPILMAVLILIVLAILIGTFIYWLHARNFETTDDAFIDGHVVAISPRVAANVSKVLVDDNFVVKKGQVLVELDPTDFQLALDQATANAAAAQGKYDEAVAMVSVKKANVSEAQAEVDVAQTNANNAARDLKRYLALDEKARSQQQLDNANAADKANSATVEQAKAKMQSAQAEEVDSERMVDTAASQVKVAISDVNSARVKLSYCTITAPEDGILTRKSVEPGSYVTEGQALFSIVPREVWITANFKETQLAKMYVGQPVDIEVDAYPDHTFHGSVDSIQNGTGSRFTLLPPENATGNYVKVVQRVPVKIVFDSGETNLPGHLLAPGMSVDPKVNISERPQSAGSIEPQLQR